MTTSNKADERNETASSDSLAIDIDFALKEVREENMPRLRAMFWRVTSTISCSFEASGDQTLQWALEDITRAFVDIDEVERVLNLMAERAGAEKPEGQAES